MMFGATGSSTLTDLAVVSNLYIEYDIYRREIAEYTTYNAWAQDVIEHIGI